MPRPVLPRPNVQPHARWHLRPSRAQARHNGCACRCHRRL